MGIEELLSKLNGRTPKILGSERFRTYGILIPLIIKENRIYVVFEVRSMELRSQPGEICFPGGRLEKNDQSPMDAAIRETVEELGIQFENIENVQPLDYMIQSIEGRFVYPFVGMIHADSVMDPNPSEVKEIFMVPLDYLLKSEPESYSIHFKVMPEEKFPLHLIPGGKNYAWKTREIKEYFYYYNDYVIWGLTANILRHFLSLLK